MYKAITVVLFLIVSFSSTSQSIVFFEGTNFPARPSGSLEAMKHLLESQMIYPQVQLNNKLSAEVFVSVKINWEGKIESIRTNSDSTNQFAKEAIRLVRLIQWHKDKIREGKNIDVQQVKIIFNAKRYSRVLKKREAKPLAGSDFNCYALSQLTEVPTIIESKSIAHFMAENFKYPSLALQQGISGKVTIKFIIETNGKASNFEIISALSGGCNDETIRLLKLASWNAGQINENAVRTKFSYTLNFNHPGNTYR